MANLFHANHKGLEFSVVEDELRGETPLDSYRLSFFEDGEILIIFSQTETLNLAGVAHAQSSGAAGTGTLSYEKNDVSASGSTSFSAGDVLKVILAGSTVPSAVEIPRIW